jgi:hypothetical protein
MTLARRHAHLIKNYRLVIQRSRKLLRKTDRLVADVTKVEPQGDK